MQSREFAARARGRRNVRPNSVRCAQYHESRKRARRAKAAHEYEKRHTTSFMHPHRRAPVQSLRASVTEDARFSVRKQRAMHVLLLALCCTIGGSVHATSGVPLASALIELRGVAGTGRRRKLFAACGSGPLSARRFGARLRERHRRSRRAERRARRVVARGARLAQAANRPRHGRRQARAG